MTLTVLFYLVLSFAGGVAIARVQRIVMKNIKMRKKQTFTAGHKNIGTPDRVLRITLAVILLVWGVYTQSDVLLIAAGYTTYEAFAKWCGFYALLGANTCPMD